MQGFVQSELQTIRDHEVLVGFSRMPSHALQAVHIEDPLELSRNLNCVMRPGCALRLRDAVTLQYLELRLAGRDKEVRRWRFFQQVLAPCGSCQVDQEMFPCRAKRVRSWVLEH